MAKKFTLADIGKILKKDKADGDTSYWGVVKSVNTDSDGKVTSYNVSLGGDAGTTKCRKLAGAKVGDTVFVTLRKTGEAVVIGTKNGDTDAADAQQLANALSDRLTTAEGNIAIAQASANGKNTIYYSSSEPTGGTYKDGDTWFDIANGNKIYERSGSAWVGIELGEDAIANLAITNAKIANGTIQSGKIANLDAGSITGNLISAINTCAETATINSAKIGSLTIGKVANLQDTLDGKATTQALADEATARANAISTVADNLQSETTRATSAEGALSDILSETSVSAEQALQSVNEEIVNRLATSLVELGYVQIQNGSIVVSSNASPRSKLQITSSILCILYSNVPKAWVSVSGNKSTFNIDEATISTLRMRNAQGVGTLGWVADENGHLKLKAV